MHLANCQRCWVSISARSVSRDLGLLKKRDAFNPPLSGNQRVRNAGARVVDGLLNFFGKPALVGEGALRLRDIISW